MGHWQTVKKTDQTPQHVAPDLFFHCLTMSHKKDARLKWVIQSFGNVLFLGKFGDRNLGD